MPPKLAAVIAWLTVTGFLGGVGGYYMVPQLLYLHDVAKSNRVTHGEIIEIYPRMHSTCKYRYIVEAQLYEQTGMHCGDDGIGQQTTVYFSPADPGKSVNYDPTGEFTGDLIGFVLMLILLPMLTAIIAYQRARHGTLWSNTSIFKRDRR